MPKVKDAKTKVTRQPSQSPSPSGSRRQKGKRARRQASPSKSENLRSSPSGSHRSTSSHSPSPPRSATLPPQPSGSHRSTSSHSPSPPRSATLPPQPQMTPTKSQTSASSQGTKDVPPSEGMNIWEKLTNANPKTIPHVVVITDIAKDFDDLGAMILLAMLHRLGLIKLIGFVANLMPEKDRALFARGALDSLGLEDIPVAIGTKGSTKIYKTEDYEFQSPDGKRLKFMPQASSRIEKSGKEFLHERFKSAEKSKQKLTVLLISSFQDIAEFTETKEGRSLFINNTEKVVMQGGCSYGRGYNKKTEKYDVGEERIGPQARTTNNDWHPESSEKFFQLLVKSSIPTVVYTRAAATALELPVETFKGWAETKHCLGEHLYNVYFAQTKVFIANALRPGGHRDKQWIVHTSTTYGKKHPDVPLHKCPNNAEAYVKYCKNVLLYDALAALGTLDKDVLESLDVLSNWDGFKNFRVVGVEKAREGECKAPGDLPHPSTRLAVQSGMHVAQMRAVIDELVKRALLDHEGNKNYKKKHVS